MSTCNGCGETITWARTVKGKHIALDPELREDGNVIPTGRRIPTGRGQVVEVRVIPRGEMAQRELLVTEGLRYYPHAATCTNPPWKGRNQRKNRRTRRG